MYWMLNIDEMELLAYLHVCDYEKVEVQYKNIPISLSL